MRPGTGPLVACLWGPTTRTSQPTWRGIIMGRCWMFSNRAMESRSWIYKIRNNGDLTISSCWNGTAEFSIPYLCIFIWTHSMNVNFEWTDFVVNKIRPRRELHEEFWYISLSKKVSMGTTKREVTNHDAGEECCRQIMSRNDYYWLKKTFLSLSTSSKLYCRRSSELIWMVQAGLNWIFLPLRRQQLIRGD